MNQSPWDLGNMFGRTNKNLALVALSNICIQIINE
jgi:hypothetical protein